MKKTAPILVGLALLILAAVCPLPPFLGVPGVRWRVLLGRLGCLTLVFGVYRLVRNR